MLASGGNLSTNASNGSSDEFPYLEAGREDEDPMAAWSLALQSGCLIVILISSLVANLIVALTLIMKARLITPSNRLVFNLTVSNGSLSVFVLPFVIWSVVRQEWNFGIFWCNFSAFLTLLVSLSGVLTLAMIAMDRYYAIVKPLMYTLTMTPAKSSAMLLWAWIQACVCSIPPLFGWSRFEYHEAIGACAVVWSANVVYSAIVLTTCILAPFIVMLACYHHIFQVARTKYRKVHVGTVSDASTEVVEPPSSATVGHRQPHHPRRLSAPRKTSLMMAAYNSPVKGFWTICIVLGAFVVTWIPYVALAFGEMVTGDSSFWSRWFQVAALWLMYASSASYPLVYGLYNRSIRKEVRACLLRPHSKAMRGLPRRNSRRLSFSGSLLDYSPYRGRRLVSSRRLSSDLSRMSADLGSFADFLKVNARKNSQDSGAVLTESDLDAEAACLSPAWLHRRVSAPSRLQNSTTRPASTSKDESRFPLPILKPIRKERGNSRKLNRSNEAMQLCDIPSLPMQSDEAKLECVIPETRLHSCMAFERKMILVRHGTSLDEGIVNDVVVEDLE